MLAMAKAAKAQNPAEALSAAVSIVDRLGLSFGSILNALERTLGLTSPGWCWTGTMTAQKAATLRTTALHGLGDAEPR